VSQLIRVTLNIPFHLTKLNDNNKFDIRMAYTKYLAILDTEERLNEMRRAGTWKQKATFTDIVDIFMSKTVYHRSPSKIFPSVPLYPLMEKWLQGTDDAPTTSEIWGGKRQTYDNLQEIIELYVEASNKKGKKRQEDSGSDMTKKKKEKKLEDSGSDMMKKKKEKKSEGTSKKGSSSKSRY
jgi:hypothetical protein